MHIFAIFLTLWISTEVTSLKVPCKKIDTITWTYFSYSEQQKTCVVGNVEIISTDSTIYSTRDIKMKALNFDKNRKVEFLPENVWLTFPELVFYDASHCNIKALSKNNFVNLRSMEYFWFGDNQIEKIDDDTFEDLFSVKQINLGEFH